MNKPTYVFSAFAILAALALEAQTPPTPAPTPAPTPPPLEVTLSAPVSIQRTVTEETTDATVEWLLLTPGAASITAKIQPVNHEVKISGADYAAIVGIIEGKVRDGKSLRQAFAEALQPHIQDALTP